MNSIRINLFFLFLLKTIGLILLSTACSKRENEAQGKKVTSEGLSNNISIVDARNRSVSLNHPAIRVVSLLPSITEYMF